MAKDQASFLAGTATSLFHPFSFTEHVLRTSQISGVCILHHQVNPIIPIVHRRKLAWRVESLAQGSRASERQG